MIYIDPSELKENSKLLNCLPKHAKYEVCKFEQFSGADVIVTLDDLPKPSTETLLKLHLKKGCFLIQNKFDLDLTGSILDGRYKDEQSRMIDLGAYPAQSVCFSIGVIHSRDGEIRINNQSIYGNNNLKPNHLKKQIILWAIRGGSFYQETSAKEVWEWYQSFDEVLRLVHREKERVIFPLFPSLYEEQRTNKNLSPIEYEYMQSQRLIRIKDLRNTLITLPGIGEELVNEIWAIMPEKTLGCFLSLLQSGELTRIKGIGQGTVKKIKLYLGV